MVCWIQRHWLIALGLGLLCGIALGGFWPHTPLYAVASDHGESFAMATGPLDADVEAVYLLDFLTGELRAIVLGKQPGMFSAFYMANVARDLGVDPQKNPKFLMVTGMVGLRRGGGNRAQPSNAACYIAEITSGELAAYSVPWSPSMYASGQPQNGQLFLVGKTRFRTPVGLGPGGAAGPAVPAK